MAVVSRLIDLVRNRLGGICPAVIAFLVATFFQHVPLFAGDGVTPPRFTAKQIQSFIAEVVPHIERIMGRKFKELPPLVLDDEDTFARIVAADLEPTLRRAHPELSEQELAKAALARAKEQAVDLLGKYGLKLKKLGLMPASLGPMLEQYQIEPQHATGIMRLLIAHELTHALQAQYVDVLGFLANRPTEDASAAYTSVVEGQAMFVQQGVARALGLEKAAAEYARIFSLGDLEADDPHSRDVAVYQHFMYIEGQRFIEYHHRQGGTARLWELLVRPPLISSMISHPETYSPGLPKRPDLTGAFVEAVAEFRKNRWVVHEQELGEIHLRAMYASLEKEGLNRLADNVIAARSLSLRSLARGEDFHLVLFALRDRKVASELIDLLALPVAEELKAWRQESGHRVKETRDAKLGGLVCDASRDLALVLADGHGREVFSKRVVLASRGAVLVEATAVNHSIPSHKLARILDGVLRAAEKAPVK